MIGHLRFVLACLVVANHVWLPTANKIGLHAVAGFFIISGYLMTTVIVEVYRGRDGTMRYLVNRFLRIYPLYWFVCALTLLGLAAAPQIFVNVYSLIAVPNTIGVWMSNATLINLIQSPVILVPPAWSLTVECAFYIIIGVGLSRERWTAVIWFTVSVVYTLWLIYEGAPFGARYSTVLAGSLFFSTGSVIYHYRNHLSALQLPLFFWVVLLLLFSVFPILVSVLGGDRDYLGYYGSAILFVPLFVSALFVKPTRLGAWLGDLAYPMFLMHFFAIGLVRLLFPVHLSPLSTSEALLVFAATFIMFCAVVRWFDPRLNKLRDAVRPKRRHAPVSETIKAAT